jgi:hypothetical protein
MGEAVFERVNFFLLRGVLGVELLHFVQEHGVEELTAGQGTRPTKSSRARKILWASRTGQGLFHKGKNVQTPEAQNLDFA